MERWNRAVLRHLQGPLAVLLGIALSSFTVAGVADDGSKGGVARSAQHLFKTWNFDKQAVGETPAGFSSHTVGAPLAGLWKVQPDPGAPTAPNILMQAAPCPEESCFHVLLVNDLVYEYPDVAVRLRLSEGAIGESSGWGGVVFGARGADNLYAVIVDLGVKKVEVIRVSNGKTTILGQAPVKRKKAAWHMLRVSRDTIISKEYVEVSFNGEIVLSVEEKTLEPGQIGLMTWGGATMAFDNLHAAPLYSQQPLSPPAAY